MKVVIYDSSSMYSASYLIKDVEFMNTIITNKDYLDIRFCTPEIVVDEIKNKLSEEVNEINQEFKKLERRYRKITDEGIKLVESNDDSLITEEKTEDLKRRITSIVNSVGEILPYPKVNHKSVVSRALMRKKPFDSKGHNGYRDALIWETIREYIIENKEIDFEIIFLSNNPKDFFDLDEWKKDVRKLSPELEQEIQDIGFDQTRFHCYSSLSDYCNENVIPLLADMDELRPNILEGDFTDKLEQYITDDFISTEDIQRKLDYEHDNVEINYVGLIQIIQILEMKKISDTTTIIHVECEFEYNAHIYIYKMDYYGMAEEIGSVTDWNNHYFQKEISDTFSTDLLITYDLKKDQILSVSR